jgi:adenine-specific DNA-methyltransferase
MFEQTSIEGDRQRIQVILDSERGQEERNKLGQFATPPALAREIALVALAYLGDTPIRFFEPSIGSGAFFSALLAECPDKRLMDAHGIELDERFAEAARSLWGDSGLRVTAGDFTRLVPPTACHDRANLVLANPPYVRHHHLGRERKTELQKLAETIVGCKVSGLTGLYVYFIVLAHQWIARDAVAAWLVPSEWMDVNYGAALKEYLCGRVQLLRVHRFDAADVQFGDALVSSSVIFIRNQPPSGDETCEFTVGALSSPSLAREARLRELRSERKWSQHFRRSPSATPTIAAAQVTLGDLVDVKRGIATGGNEFFIQPRADFLAMGVPGEFLRPILPSSKHLDGDTIERGPDGFPDLPQPLALLDCDLDENEVRQKHPRLWEYLESPAGQQVRQGYLTSGRRPWYSQERRARAPVIVTYMGRGRKGAFPFRFFWNQSDATATNVFLLLIPKGPLAALLHEAPEMARLVRDFLAETDPSELQGHGRVYGGGLHKLEPRELGRLDASKLCDRLGLRPAAPRQLELRV